MTVSAVQVREEWDKQIARLPALLNIARFSLLTSFTTFHILANYFSTQIGYKIRALPIFSTHFYLWAGCYIALIVFSLMSPNWQQQQGSRPNVRIAADITMLAWLMHISGGVDTGLGILILPFVVAACLMNYGRHALLLASYAAMLLLVSLVLRDWPFEGINAVSRVVQTLVLALCCYLVAGLSALASSRLNKTYVELRRHSRTVDRLRELNDLVINYFNEAVVVADGETRIVLANRKAVRYFPNIRTNERNTIFADLIDRWQHNPRDEFSTMAEVYGQAVHVRAHPVLRRDGNLLMMFIRSERDRAAEAMVDKLKALGQLTANLAHEIRNPLSAISHSNGLLAEQEELDPFSKKMHGIIDNNIARINRMLEDITNLNRSDRLNPQSINLMQFWLAFKREFLLANPDARHALSFQIEKGKAVVFADAAHLQQIMWNLVNNAWQYCSKKPHSVKILVRPMDDFPAFLLSVIDDGPGVSAQDQSRLFEPFFTTRSEGTGLGLYVARELAHANRGDLYYLPDIKGFELSLPKEIYE